ncbi:DUF6193 family natural product biosynthesis protein [Streptomyces canus]|uniref:DUF6193 family natural product biosynthesis protein n=1 Tax=Streptomyces canus TaxID=58343 RepID=UPI0022571A1F|nr:DUF6193 family natural product biosynthesis protein [Streptomyces canus]
MAKKDTLSTAPDDPVAAKRQVVRDMDANLIGTALVEAASANPALRALFPLVGHGSLQFSRCTRVPWQQGLPSILSRLGHARRTADQHPPRAPEPPHHQAIYPANEDPAVGALSCPFRLSPKGVGPPS